MLFKKSKAVVAAVLSVAMAANAMIATMGAGAYEKETRTKAEAFGDSTYAERFMSLYDDVVTKGKENGYLSSEGIPYHAVEEVIIEAPDYGHETTSEAMSYLVWIAAMRDNLANKGVVAGATGTGELEKAWNIMEYMIPKEQGNFWSGGTVSADYCGEYSMPQDCPWGQESNLTGKAENPIYQLFVNAYSSEKGLYLMHWLADVDNWYGFGGSNTDFIFINTFQRGEQESCWETVPHPCVETKQYGDIEKNARGESKQGMKGIFNTEDDVANQYAYTNAPDAEDRAIQGVYDAIKWGVGVSSVTAKAAMMGDELRNNMYDKYYRTIGAYGSGMNSWGGTAENDSAHYLMNWYTSWGGSLGSNYGDWKWQIGCSHAHEFYQNPLAAYALVAEDSLKSGMKATGAVDDYMSSLTTQMEFYQWLQSADGPIAGGATNSWNGRYEAYPSGTPTFNGMAYVEHPVYADPGSNHWIGNQVWAVQRLAELYYWEKQDGNGSIVSPGGVSLDAALEKILDKWVAWFVNNTILTEDGNFYIPSNLNWNGKPDTWTGKQSENTGLTCTITGYGNTDFGCVSSLANTLTYYAKAKGVEVADIAGLTESSVGGTFSFNLDDSAAKAGSVVYATSGDAKLPAAGLYLAQQLMDRMWDIGRDDIGLTRVDHNGSLARMFEQWIYIPGDYTGKMPNGDDIVEDASFLSIRSMYESASNCVGAKTSQEALDLVQKLKQAWERDVANGATWNSDISASSTEGGAMLAKYTEIASVDLKYHRFWHAGDELMALGVLAELYPDLKPTDGSTDPNPTDPTDDETGELNKKDYGDANVDGKVSLADVVLVNKHLMVGDPITKQGEYNADVDDNGDTDEVDSLNILKYIIKLVEFPVK